MRLTFVFGIVQFPVGCVFFRGRPAEIIFMIVRSVAVSVRDLVFGRRLRAVERLTCKDVIVGFGLFPISRNLSFSVANTFVDRANDYPPRLEGKRIVF